MFDQREYDRGMREAFVQEPGQIGIRLLVGWADISAKWLRRSVRIAVIFWKNVLWLYVNRRGWIVRLESKNGMPAEIR
jgi:hypothetical protein